MAAGLSTAAWVAHDLGIATGVGGSLFGRMALHPATRNISDRAERGMVVNDAWKTFNTVQLGALGVMALTWFAGRTMLTGREVGASARKLVLLKDALVIGTFVSAIGASIAGRKLGTQGRPDGAVPLDSEGNVAADAPKQAKGLDRLTDVFGITNLVCGAGVIAVTAILAMQSGKSSKWSVVSRFLA